MAEEPGDAPDTAAGQEVPPSILDRMTAAGIDVERATKHLTSGLVHLDGQSVESPDHLAPHGTRWLIKGS